MWLRHVSFRVEAPAGGLSAFQAGVRTVEAVGSFNTRSSPIAAWSSSNSLTSAASSIRSPAAEPAPARRDVRE